MAVSFSPMLWYAEEAEAAARFYVGLIPNSRVDGVFALPVDTPSGPAGSVKVVEMTLAGSRVLAMTAKPLDAFNHAISLTLACDTQVELDLLWDGLLEGGAAEACGWLRDRYGLSWQIMPRRLLELIAGPDRERAARVTTAMLGMVKLDLGAIEAA
jgi:predicted 3-demethylubiquinone-9 3-methyltransferase (glyoxalase superfamily)